MSKKLVIVESPSKSKTIEKYLGKDYKVLSSKGHIRDLATKGKYGLGVDIENHFAPKYVTIKGKKKVIDELINDKYSIFTEFEVSQVEWDERADEIEQILQNVIWRFLILTKNNKF